MSTPVAIMGMTLPPQKGYKKSASEETLNRTAYFISMKNGQKSNAMLMHVQLLLVERGERVQQVVDRLAKPVIFVSDEVRDEPDIAADEMQLLPDALRGFMPGAKKQSSAPLRRPKKTMACALLACSAFRTCASSAS